MKHTLNRQTLIEGCLEGIRVSGEDGAPHKFHITFSYSGHEEIVCDEIMSVEEAVDALIEIVGNHNEDPDDLGYCIDGVWGEDDEIFMTIEYFEINPYVDDN